MCCLSIRILLLLLKSIVLDHQKVSENITKNKSNWSDNADHKLNKNVVILKYKNSVLNSKQCRLHYVRE